MPTRHLDHFIDRVRALRTSDADREHARLVATLRALADALDEVIGNRRRSGTIRTLALELGRSGPQARHTPLVADAIADALVAIQARGRLDDAGALAHGRALRAYEQLAPREPLLAQRDRVRRALEGLANTLASIAGAPAPFPRSDDAAGTGPDVAAVRRYAGELHELVENAGSSRSSSAARAHLAEALDVIANAIRVAPASLGRAQVASLASRVSFASTQLERLPGISLERGDYAAAGLTAAIDALRALADAPRGTTVATMIDRADAAVGAIDEHTPFGLARPQIQDALRAVADAYLVFASEL